MRSEWLRSISSHEYAELLALSRLERIGYERTDLYSAAATTGNPGDFCFEPEPEQSDEDIFAGFSQIVVMSDDGNTSSHR